MFMNVVKRGRGRSGWLAAGAVLAVLVIAAGAGWALASAGSGARSPAGATAGTAAGTTAGKTASPAAGDVPAAVTASTTSAARALPLPVRCGSCWRPKNAESWQIELSQTPRRPYPKVAMIEADGFGTPASTVADLHRSDPGRGVVCYIDAGTWENWRPDAGQFPKSLLGRPDSGWAGERWLDIAHYRGALARIMTARAAMCKRKGFNAVDFDNVDGYGNKTGFPLTAANQLRYDVFLANTTHRLGLSVALKNDLTQIPVLVRYFDFAVDEQCFQFAQCTTRQNGGFGLDEFTAAGKAVFDVEYALPRAKFCPAARHDHFSALRKHLSLDAWRESC